MRQRFGRSLYRLHASTALPQRNKLWLSSRRLQSDLGKISVNTPESYSDELQLKITLAFSKNYVVFP